MWVGLEPALCWFRGFCLLVGWFLFFCFFFFCSERKGLILAFHVLLGAWVQSFSDQVAGSIEEDTVSSTDECVTHWMALPGGSPAYPRTAGLQNLAHLSDGA